MATEPTNAPETDEPSDSPGRSRLRRVVLPVAVLGAAGAAAYVLGKVTGGGERVEEDGRARGREDRPTENDEASEDRQAEPDEREERRAARPDPPRRDPREMEAARRERQARREERRKRAKA